MANMDYGANEAEVAAERRIYSKVTDTIHHLLKLQCPDRQEQYFCDMVLAQSYAPPEQRAVAQSKLMLNGEPHTEQQLISTAMRMVDIRAQVIAGVVSPLEDQVEREAGRLIEQLRPLPEPTTLAQVPPELHETIANSTVTDVQNHLGALHALAAKTQSQMHPHCGFLQLAADHHQAVEALPGMAGGTIPFVAEGLGKDVLARMNSSGQQCQGNPDRAKLRAEIKPALEAYSVALVDLQCCLASAAEQGNRCAELQRAGAELVASQTEAQQRAMEAQRYHQALDTSLAGRLADNERWVREQEMARLAHLAELRTRYQRIKELQQKLAVERLAAQQQEQEVLASVARQWARTAVIEQLPARLADHFAAAEATRLAWEKEAAWADACHRAYDRILEHCTTQLEQYEQQVGSQLASTREAHWLIFKHCCQFVERHLVQAQRRRLSGAQALQLRKAEYTNWRQLHEPEAEGTREWEVFQQCDARWQQDMKDMDMLQEARDSEVANWLQVRAFICQNMEQSGTKEVLALCPEGQSLVEQDPREAFCRADRSVECQAAVRQLLQLMRQTHLHFETFHEEVQMAEEWQRSWVRLGECCVALLQQVLHTAAAKERGVAEETDSVGHDVDAAGSSGHPTASLTPMLGPSDLDAYLSANPFLARQLADCQRTLREDLLTHGRDMKAAWTQPCPGGSGDDLLTVWTSMLSVVDDLLEPARPHSQLVAAAAATSALPPDQQQDVVTIHDADTMSHVSGESFFDPAACINNEPSQ